MGSSTAAIVADGGPHALGHLIEVLEHFLERHLARGAGVGHRAVQVRHVGLVVPVVMNLHGLRVDVRLERPKRVGQRSQRERSRWRRDLLQRTEPTGTSSADGGEGQAAKAQGGEDLPACERHRSVFSM
jgi:hypothetical protein